MKNDESITAGTPELGPEFKKTIDDVGSQIERLDASGRYRSFENVPMAFCLLEHVGRAIRDDEDTRRRPTRRTNGRGTRTERVGERMRKIHERVPDRDGL